MPGINRVLDIAVCRISTAERAVKLLKCNIPALRIGTAVRVFVTVKAVQLVVGVVVIEGAGDVLCARLLGEFFACMSTTVVFLPLSASRIAPSLSQ